VFIYISVHPTHTHVSGGEFESRVLPCKEDTEGPLFFFEKDLCSLCRRMDEDDDRSAAGGGAGPPAVVDLNDARNVGTNVEVDESPLRPCLDRNKECKFGLTRWSLKS